MSSDCDTVTFRYHSASTRSYNDDQVSQIQIGDSQPQTSTFDRRREHHRLQKRNNETGFIRAVFLIGTCRSPLRPMRHAVRARSSDEVRMKSFRLSTAMLSQGLGIVGFFSDMSFPMPSVASHGPRIFTLGKPGFWDQMDGIELGFPLKAFLRARSV